MINAAPPRGFCSAVFYCEVRRPRTPVALSVFSLGLFHLSFRHPRNSRRLGTDQLGTTGTFWVEIVSLPPTKVAETPPVVQK